MATTTRTLLLGSALVAMALAACTADATVPGAGSASSSSAKKSSKTSDANDTSDTSEPSTDTSPSSPAESPSPSPTPSVNAATCAAKPDLMACIDCCTAGSQTAFKVADDAFKTCACGASGPCRTACAADFCAGKDTQPSNACLACLDQKTASCEQTADAACEADATCKAASVCATTAKCDDKPET